MMDTNSIIESSVDLIDTISENNHTPQLNIMCTSSKPKTMEDNQVIPFLKGPHSLNFSRLHSDCYVQDRVINIEAQHTLPTRTYQMLQTLSNVDLLLTLDQFTRMWKTILLSRVQDVVEKEKFVMLDNHINISGNIMLPAPLADLCYSIGQFNSKSNGIIYHTIPPTRPNPPPDWWSVDVDIISLWSLTMGQLSTKYEMRIFPSSTDYKNKPIILTAINDTDNMTRSVKAYTNEVRPCDAFVRFVNDELYEPVPHMSYGNCHLCIEGGLNKPAVISQYVASYIKS